MYKEQTGNQENGGSFPKRRGTLREESPMWARVLYVEAGIADTKAKRIARTAHISQLLYWVQSTEWIKTPLLKFRDRNKVLPRQMHASVVDKK